MTRPSQWARRWRCEAFMIGGAHWLQSGGFYRAQPPHPSIGPDRQCIVGDRHTLEYVDHVQRVFSAEDLLDRLADLQNTTQNRSAGTGQPARAVSAVDAISCSLGEREPSSHFVAPLLECSLVGHCHHRLRRLQRGLKLSDLAGQLLGLCHCGFPRLRRRYQLLLRAAQVRLDALRRAPAVRACNTQHTRTQHTVGEMAWTSRTIRHTHTRST